MPLSPCLSLKQLLYFLDRESLVTLPVNHCVAVRAHDTQIYSWIDPGWAGFRYWFVMVDVDKPRSPLAVLTGEIHAACHADKTMDLECFGAVERVSLIVIGVPRLLCTFGVVALEITVGMWQNWRIPDRLRYTTDPIVHIVQHFPYAKAP